MLPARNLVGDPVPGLEQLPKALPVSTNGIARLSQEQIAATNQSQECLFKPQHHAAHITTAREGRTPVRARRSIGVVQNIAHMATTSPSAPLDPV
jgi:hypothetical protein